MIRIPFRPVGHRPNLTPIGHLMGQPVSIGLKSGGRVEGVIVQQVFSGWIRVVLPEGGDTFLLEKDIVRVTEVQDHHTRLTCTQGFHLWRRNEPLR